jgi:hypothetical protein
MILPATIYFVIVNRNQGYHNIPVFLVFPVLYLISLGMWNAVGTEYLQVELICDL